MASRSLPGELTPRMLLVEWFEVSGLRGIVPITIGQGVLTLFTEYGHADVTIHNPDTNRLFAGLGETMHGEIINDEEKVWTRNLILHQLTWVTLTNLWNCLKDLKSLPIPKILVCSKTLICHIHLLACLTILIRIRWYCPPIETHLRSSIPPRAGTREFIFGLKLRLSTNLDYSRHHAVPRSYETSRLISAELKPTG